MSDYEKKVRNMGSSQAMFDLGCKSCAVKVASGKSVCKNSDALGTATKVIEFYETGLKKYLKLRKETIKGLISDYEDKDGYVSLEDTEVLQRLTGRKKEISRILKRLESGKSVADLIREEERRQYQDVLNHTECDLVIDF